MKKMMLIILCVLLTVPLASCGDSTEPEKNETVLYTTIGSNLYRINTETANIVQVCPDPWCRHNDAGCPFYLSAEICPEGRMLYYMRTTEISWGGYYDVVCGYDTSNGKYKELYKPEVGTVRDLLVCGGYLFFNRVELAEDYSETYYLMRYTLQSGKVVCLNEEGTPSHDMPIGSDGERICFESFVGNTYTTDLDYKNRVDGERIYADKASSGPYVFDLELKDQRRAVDGGIDFIFKMTRTDTRTDKTITVFEELGVMAPIIYNDKIIYGKLDDPKLLGYTVDEETGTPFAKYDKWGGKFYICNLDGSGEQLLCNIPEGGYAVYFGPDSIIGGNGVGDCIVTRVFKYKNVGERDGKMMIERDDNAYLIINTVTGEVKVAEIEMCA